MIAQRRRLESRWLDAQRGVLASILAHLAVLAIEIGLVVGALESGWLGATLFSLCLVSIASVLAYIDESSRERPGVPATTAAAILIGALWVARSAHDGAAGVVLFLTVMGSCVLWGGYARMLRVARLEATRLENEQAMSSLSENAGRMDQLERLEPLIRARIAQALETARGVAFAARRLADAPGDVSALRDACGGFASTTQLLLADLRALRDSVVNQGLAKTAVLTLPAPVPMESHFRRWAASTHTHLSASHSIAADLGSTVGFWLAMTALGSLVPWTRDVIALDPWPIIAGSIAAVPIFLARRVFARSIGGNLTYILVATSLVQAMTALLIARSSAAGATVYVACYPSLVLAHAFHFRITLRTPYGLLPIVIGLALGLAAAGALEQRVILISSFLFCLPGVFVAGALGRRLDEATERASANVREWQRRAQIDFARRIDALATELRTLASGAHDAGSPVLALAVVAERLDGATVTTEIDHEKLRTLARRAQRHAEEAGARLSRALMTPKSELALEIKPVDLELMLASVERARESAPQLAIETEVPSGLAAKVYAGTESLVRILDNVLANACQAARTKLRATVRASDDQIVVNVEDDGPGFREGYRTAPMVTDKAEGTGLGLYTVQQLVVLSGGELELGRSEQLGGARVSIYLPRGRAR
jgi:signal transduction histidine kinase